MNNSAMGDTFSPKLFHASNMFSSTTQLANAFVEIFSGLKNGMPLLSSGGNAFGNTGLAQSLIRCKLSLFAFRKTTRRIVSGGESWKFRNSSYIIFWAFTFLSYFGIPHFTTLLISQAKACGITRLGIYFMFITFALSLRHRRNR